MKSSDEAALCVLALPILHRLGQAHGTASSETVRRLGVARSFAYERATRLAAVLEQGLDASRVSGEPEVREDLRLTIEVDVLRYRVSHPGCWVEGGRTVYSPDLRRFVLELATRHGLGRVLEQGAFAAACGLPLPTLKDWLAVTPTERPAADDGATAGPGPPASAAAANIGASGAPADATTSGAPAPSADTPAAPPAPAAATNIGASGSPADATTSGAPGPSMDTPAAPASNSGGNPATASDASESPQAAVGGVRFSLEMTRIFHEWDQWRGSFAAFVEHLRTLQLHHGKRWVRAVLYLAAACQLLRRPPPKPAGRGSTFRPLPGLQWTSDGKQFNVVVDGRTFTITWQPMTDVGSTATVGSAVRPEEDTAGLVASLEEGVRTTGAPPAALLLDNKACNDSEALHDALPEGTILMHATRARPQNKAVIEGQFGLFAQELGPVIANVDTSTPEAIALSVGEAVVRGYAQGRNRRPRAGGKSAFELYRDAIHTPEVVTAQIETLQAIKRRVDEREKREAARRDPRVAAALEDAMLRLALVDDGDVLASLRNLPLVVVQTAIATFAAKRDAGSLPVDAGLRYLAGIARNCQSERELRFFEEHLVDQLARSGDLVLSYLKRKAAALDDLDLGERLLAIVRERLAVREPVAQVFWHDRLRVVASAAPPALRPALRRFLCEHIRRTFAVPKNDRRQLIDLLVRELADETGDDARP